LVVFFVGVVKSAGLNPVDGRATKGKHEDRYSALILL